MDVKNALSVFWAFSTWTFFKRFLWTFSSRFLNVFYLLVLNVFFAFFNLAGQVWTAAGLRPPGGLRAGASEVALPLPQRFCTFLNSFLYVFYRNNAVPTSGGNMPPGWAGGRKDGKGYRFLNVFLSVFWTFFTTVFWTFSCPFLKRFLRQKTRKKRSCRKCEKNAQSVFYIHI